jgi:hypothetical protein
VKHLGTPVDVLLAVAAIGGRLAVANGEALRMLLPPDAPQELKQAIRERKGSLIELLRLDFRIVKSDVLNSTVLWTPDSRTKDTLVAAGADPGTTYTAEELAVLVNKRVTCAELPQIHEAKQRFNGRITNET